MADDRVVLAIDQGTSSTKSVVVSSDGAVLARHSVPLAQQHPGPGWVEQSPDEIVDSVRAGIRWADERFGDRVAAIGLSTQRESAVAWDDATGKARSAVIGWQDRRTRARVADLAGASDLVRRRSGLPLDPMFSALKFGYLLDDLDPTRRLARSGRLRFGTVDAWLVRSLTGETRIEAGNASRTQLLDVETGEWSPELLELFDVPEEALPTVVASDAPTGPVDGRGTRIRAILGDSHAALYGHGIREPGAVKATYGTGSSVMGIETEPTATPGLCRTIAWRTGSRTAHAFEGNVLSTGATLVWLAQLLGVDTDEILRDAESGDSTVDLVPAFSGLGAPWWDENAVGLLTGLDLGVTRADLSRAAAESIALQVEDVLAAVDELTGHVVHTVHADGGPTASDFLMQLQSDISQRTVRRSDVPELSAIGAATLAGAASGLIDPGEGAHTDFVPLLGAEAASTRRSRWLAAVAQSRSHAPEATADAVHETP